jgi:hypothetical protein
VTDSTWEDAFAELVDAQRQLAVVDAALRHRRRGGLLVRLRTWAFGPPAHGYLWERERRGGV